MKTIWIFSSYPFPQPPFLPFAASPILQSANNWLSLRSCYPIFPDALSLQIPSTSHLGQQLFPPPGDKRGHQDRGQRRELLPPHGGAREPPKARAATAPHFLPIPAPPAPGSRRSRAPSPPGLDSGERTSGARTAVEWQLHPAHAGAAAGYGWPQLQAPPPAGPPPSTPSRLGSANRRLPGAA
ncbi:PREDICTED: basic proline-rich protein-like [Cercocebus atys]|uniref:basic proline-rich protein-like n=1 Tax=Cercocebus atys TaxID=9531 RepID=UPI0005F44826|nr:PREDICTED: basic proline-rich protein-like [Cercocebus atys]